MLRDTFEKMRLTITLDSFCEVDLPLLVVVSISPETEDCNVDDDVDDDEDDDDDNDDGDEDESSAAEIMSSRSEGLFDVGNVARSCEVDDACSSLDDSVIIVEDNEDDDDDDDDDNDCNDCSFRDDANCGTSREPKGVLMKYV
jgi:hypothetical protein